MKRSELRNLIKQELLNEASNSGNEKQILKDLQSFADACDRLNTHFKKDFVADFLLEGYPKTIGESAWFYFNDEVKKWNKIHNKK